MKKHFYNNDFKNIIKICASVLASTFAVLTVIAKVKTIEDKRNPELAQEASYITEREFNLYVDYIKRIIDVIL